jgi:hypothetical protein
VIRAKTDLPIKGKNSDFGRFLEEINAELVTGKTAYLEIEGPEKNSFTFEISRFE